MKKNTLGNRIIVTDLKEDNTTINTDIIINEAGVNELVKGVVKFVPKHLLEPIEPKNVVYNQFKEDNVFFKEGCIVWYSPTTGSRFKHEGVVYRSISNPIEAIIFKEEENDN